MNPLPPGESSPSTPQYLADKREPAKERTLRALSRQLGCAVRPIKAASPKSPLSTVFQHSVLCQTGMPYRDPGIVRTWERTNGRVQLRIEAGSVFRSELKAFAPVGLPFGPRARCVLYHLNAQALRLRSRTLDLESSLTGFISRTLGVDPNGRNVRGVKDQLMRLAAARFALGYCEGSKGVTVQGTFVTGLELWAPRGQGERVPWPVAVTLSEEYYAGLIRHAVPLRESAIRALAHNAMALDVYAWLAQRLRRVKGQDSALIPWPALHEQFGADYQHRHHFRAVFVRTLHQVQAAYPQARLAIERDGLRLRPSVPPVLGRER